MILLLESSGDVCSVGLEKNGHCIGLKEEKGLNHAENLAPFVREILLENDCSTSELEAVAISGGPGSYTGLRIGAALAKGICYASDIPLISISTLQALIEGSAEKESFSFFIPMIDARRMEVYAAVYNSRGIALEEEKPFVLDENSFKEYDPKETLIIGKGAEKFKSLRPDFRFDVTVDFSAKHLAKASREKFESKTFVDLAYYEPNYIKSFQAVKAKPLL